MTNKINRKVRFFSSWSPVLIAAVILFIPPLLSLAYAEEIKEDDNIADYDKSLPKSGVLSSTHTSGVESRSVGIWGKKDAAVDAQAPVSGSVSKVSGRWVMRVFNNTADGFDIDVRVKQTNSQGNMLHSDNYTLRLKPEESAERTMAAFAGSSDAQLELVSWKRRPAAKPTIKAGSEHSLTTQPSVNVTPASQSEQEGYPEPVEDQKN